MRLRSEKMEELIRKELDAQTVIAIQCHGSYDEIGAVYHELHELARILRAFFDTD